MTRIKLYTFLLALGVSSASWAQDLRSSEVPKSVQESFIQSGGPVKGVSWEMEDELYEAEYKVNGNEVSKVFAKDGTFIATETEMKVADLPAAIGKFTSVRFPGKKISDASEIEDADGNKVYGLEIDGEDYLFDNNGQILNAIE